MAWSAAIEKVAKAIKVAEGSPAEWNNPGDLTLSFGYETLGVANDEGVLRFASAEDGWNALCKQVFLMLSGNSKVYKTTMTIGEAGMLYSGGDPNWARNVAAVLQVPITTTLAELSHLT